MNIVHNIKITFLRPLALHKNFCDPSAYHYNILHYLKIYVCVLNCLGDNGTCDRLIVPSNQNQYIVWGIGSLGETAFQHHTRAASKL